MLVKLSKKFDGKEYGLDRLYATRSKAERTAQNYRKPTVVCGRTYWKLVRIVEVPKGSVVLVASTFNDGRPWVTDKKMYALYTRDK